MNRCKAGIHIFACGDKSIIYAAYKSRGLAGVPIMPGYLPVAVTFGIVAVQAGLSPLHAALISAAMFSGASQFLLVTMPAEGMPLPLALGLCLLLNCRHVFYGPILLPHLPAPKTALALAAFGLTDEVFALAQTRLKQKA